MLEAISKSLPKEVELESKPCPLGCGVDDSHVLNGGDLIHNLPGQFSIVRCQNCGLMRTDPRPTPTTIGYYYPDNYGPYLETKVKADLPQVARRPMWKRFVRMLFGLDHEKLPPLEPGRMLEIGCASGTFMFEMANLGWDVAGIELSQQAAENARHLGYPVHIGSVEDAPEPEELYELVVGWMVLEHLHDPVLALKKMCEWTKPGGWLVISVPDVNAASFRFFRSGWYDLHLPNHLYHFTPQTIGNILMQGGWSMDRVAWSISATNLLQSFRYKCEEKGWGKTARYLSDVIEDRKLRKGKLLLSALLSLSRQSGRMVIWAKRSDD